MTIAEEIYDLPIEYANWRKYKGAMVDIGKNVEIGNDSVICARVVFEDDVIVNHSVDLNEDVHLYNGVIVKEFTEIKKRAYIEESVTIGKVCTIGEGTRIKKNCMIGRNVIIGDDVYIPQNVHIGDDVRLASGIRLAAGMIIKTWRDLLTIGPIGSRNDYLSAARNASGEILVGTGCFDGTLEKFVAAVEMKHSKNQHAKDYSDAVREIKQWFFYGSLHEGIDLAKQD